MSRVGNNPINIPTGVEIVVEGHNVKVKGSKGELEMELHPTVKAEVLDGKVLIKRKRENQEGRNMHGLTRSLINNMVLGVSEGWTKNLEMVGVGYRAAGGGNSMTLNVGLSHPVEISAPEGITFVVSDNTKIAITGANKILVGQVAANIRAVKPPEVYKGKGIRYVGEYVRRKAGKAAKAVGVK